MVSLGAVLLSFLGYRAALEDREHVRMVDYENRKHELRLLLLEGKNMQWADQWMMRDLQSRASTKPERRKCLQEAIVLREESWYEWVSLDAEVAHFPASATTEDRLAFERLHTQVAELVEYARSLHARTLQEAREAGVVER